MITKQNINTIILVAILVVLSFISGLLISNKSDSQRYFFKNYDDAIEIYDTKTGDIYIKKFDSKKVAKRNFIERYNNQ